MSREKIIIIDYGSQFTQLIARKVRELGVYSEIINFSKTKKLKKDKLLKGIILSGGPLTATNKKTPKLNSKILNLKIPILGICYGHQILSKKLGGKIKTSKKREFGRAYIKSFTKSPIT
jgi:GMP synthase (glutamine-hydrolysing)